MDKKTDVLVIGGGPAGMMAAASAARVGARTVLLEKNEKLGKKLFLTGHGRCNVSNRADTDGYQKKIWRNPKFMLSALNAFSPADLEEFLLGNGVRLKEEDSGRLFPASDHSSDVIKAFRRELEKDDVKVLLETAVETVRKNGSRFLVSTRTGRMDAQSVILATGGLSYPSTGSTGEGFDFARELGHRVVDLGPALVGFQAAVPENFAGLTLPDAGVEIFSDSKKIAGERGSILFTHNGLSGPAVFRISCQIPPSQRFPLEARINLRPGSTEEEMSERIIETFAREAGKQVQTVLESLVPRRLAGMILAQARLQGTKRVNQLTRSERRSVMEAIRGLRIQLDGFRPISEAIITQGGVSTREIDPRTMESRLVPGLFFAGEMIDVSAMTGGYNLQVAFSMGWKAGREAAQYARKASGQ